MIFEWDEAKRIKTLKERGLDFIEAAHAWLDEYSIELAVLVDDEPRTVKVSRFKDKKIYVVVFTQRKNHIRIISMRRASKKYEEIYEEK